MPDASRKHYMGAVPAVVAGADDWTTLFSHLFIDHEKLNEAIVILEEIILFMMDQTTDSLSTQLGRQTFIGGLYLHLKKLSGFTLKTRDEKIITEILLHFFIAASHDCPLWIKSAVFWSPILTKTLRMIHLKFPKGMLEEILKAPLAQIAIQDHYVMSEGSPEGTQRSSVSTTNVTQETLAEQLDRLLAERGLQPKSVEKGATSNYPKSILDSSRSRPECISNWDFTTNHSVLETGGVNPFGCKNFAAQMEQIKMVTKLNVKKFDPVANPAAVIGWVRDIHLKSKEWDDHSNGHILSLLYIDASLDGSSFSHGIKALLSQPVMLAVDAKTKYCWLMACLVDYFSMPRYMQAADDIFRSTPVKVGSPMYDTFEVMYQNFLKSRFNDPTDESKVSIFLPQFKQVLSPKDRDLLEEQLDADVWQNFDKFKVELRKRNFKCTELPSVNAIDGGRPEKRKQTEKKPPAVSETAPHQDCLCEKCLTWAFESLKIMDRCKSCFTYGCHINKCSSPIAYKMLRCHCCGDVNQGRFSKSHPSVCPRKPKFACPRCKSLDHWLVMCPHDRSDSPDSRKEPRLS